MTTAELIEKLKALPPDAEVKTWNCYHDKETKDVCLSTDGKENVWIIFTTIGYEAI